MAKSGPNCQIFRRFCEVFLFNGAVRAVLFRQAETMLPQFPHIRFAPAPPVGGTGTCARAGQGRRPAPGRPGSTGRGAGTGLIRDQPQARSSGFAVRRLMNSTRRVPRVQGICTSQLSAVCVTDSIKRALGFMMVAPALNAGRSAVFSMVPVSRRFGAEICPDGGIRMKPRRPDGRPERAV